MSKSLLTFLSALTLFGAGGLAHADYQSSRVACDLPNFATKPDPTDAFITRVYELANELILKVENGERSIKARELILSLPANGFSGLGVGGFNTLNGEHIVQVDTSIEGEKTRHVVVQLQCDEARKKLRVMTVQIFENSRKNPDNSRVVDLTAWYDVNGQQRLGGFGSRGRLE